MGTRWERAIRSVHFVVEGPPPISTKARDRWVSMLRTQPMLMANWEAFLRL